MCVHLNPHLLLQEQEARALWRKAKLEPDGLPTGTGTRVLRQRGLTLLTPPAQGHASIPLEQPAARASNVEAHLGSPLTVTFDNVDVIRRCATK